MKRLSCLLLLLLWWQMSIGSTVRLVTIGPGDAFWSAFGHTAIAIDDVVYGFGYFSFDDDLVKSFIDNQMQYDLGASDFSHEIRLARQLNRDFSVIDLHLSTAEVNQLKDYLQWHILPENQSYGYDYFLNNCSTKVRDLLDLVWGGAVKQSSQLRAQEISHNTYFSQTFPAKHQGSMNFGLALGYGWSAYSDKNPWELMAFPVYLEQYVSTVFSDKIAPRQLIIQAEPGHSVISMFKSHWLLIVYVLLWSLLLLLKRTQQQVAKLWFMWHGLLGLLLLGLWFLTPHEVADWNFNVLLMMPFGILLFKYKMLKPVIFLCWLSWFFIAIYLKAWYLMPLLLPALMALKVISHSTADKLNLSFGGVIK